MSAVDPVYENAYTQLKEALADKALNLGEILTLAPLAMEIVEKTPNLSGEERKALALYLVRRVVNEELLKDADDAQKQMAEVVLGTPLEVAMELIIRASNGEYDLNKHLNKVQKLLKKIKDGFKKLFKRN